ncbi:SHOCT domain-containing protein [Halobacterium bonnevillei]|uniref:SHOCT domain-containing protein n=1 Tax=Halobacterium bonnevillei TaxID=2692200 RepID=A0A6B0SH10_9EURY|nr:SHOCT domain-containing protein [Halobacterium bonnevillei]MXR19201.1 SHOCT domain-containing protein [Halobacterium bonnevillei]
MKARTRRGSLAHLVAVAVVVVLVSVAALSGTAAAHGDDAGTHHHDGWMGTHTGGFGFLWLLVWTLVLVGLPVYAGYVLLSRRDADGDEPDDALAVLRRRYAAGDIDDDEFETRRQALLGEEQ